MTGPDTHLRITMSDQPTGAAGPVDPVQPGTTPPPPPAWDSYQTPAAPPQPPVAPQPPVYQQAPAYQQPYGQAPSGGAPGQAPLSQAESRQWGMLSHVGGIILGFVGPLIVMLVFGPRDGFTKDQSTEALNFQITLLIGYIAGMILAFVGLPLTPIVWVLSLIFGIMGAMAANRGEAYRYPFALRLIK